MTESSEYRPISSPCIGVCRLDSNKACIGCFRTSEEITYWCTYTDAERAEINQRVEQQAKQG